MIVHVFNSSVVSGPETLVIPALASLSEKKAVIFLTETRCAEKSLGPPAYSRSFGIQTIEIPVRSRWDLGAIKELRQTIEHLAPTIVHAHEVKASSYLAAAKHHNRHYHLVTTNHGVRAKKAPMLRLYEWIYTHWSMRAFDRVVCVCSSDRELLIRRGVPASKLRVHLNGVDRPKVEASRRAQESKRIRREWGLAERGIKPGAICLGVVGRLAPEKRHAYILRSFSELRRLRPELDVHLVIFGIGALGDTLKTQTEELGLGDRVHWMGYRGTIGEENAGFDLLVSLSFAEGLPINIVEAGWAATPVLLTSVDGNLDLVPSPEYGLCVEVSARELEIAELLARELLNPLRLSQIGEGLQRRIEQEFSGKKWIENLRRLYATLKLAP